MKWISKIRNWKTDKQTLIKQRDDARWENRGLIDDNDKLNGLNASLRNVMHLPKYNPNPWEDLEKYIEGITKYFREQFMTLHSQEMHNQTTTRGNEFAMQTLIIIHGDKQTIFRLSAETKPFQVEY